MPAWQADELEAVRACPTCGAAATEPFSHTGLHDHLENVPGVWNIRPCPHCGGLFLDPRPRPEYIGKAYHSYYTHAASAPAHEQDNGSSFLWRLANGYLNARYGTRRMPSLAIGRLIIPCIPILRQQLDFFYRHLPSASGRLLDIGCGNGVFLLRARDANWTVSGLEPDPIAAHAARQSGLDITEGTLDTFKPATAFDVITTSHVIEHVHAPGAFLKKIMESLSPGGTLWLTTPNASSMGYRWYGAALRGLEPPRHISIFSASSLRLLLEEAGFESIRFHRRGRGSRYILQSSQDISRKQGRKMQALPPLLVDIASSFATTASEELVVTARKPLP